MAEAPTMKAWQYSSTAGGLENNLTLNPSAPQPNSYDLAKDQILVEVLSMSLNPVDYKLPETPVLSRLLLSYPAVPGLDYCGKVVKTPRGNDSLAIGDIVFGRHGMPTQFGTLGQYIVAQREGCVLVPKGVDVDSAAAIGTAGITAFQSVVPNVTKGSKVFINGGSGGCGTWCIQIAKTLGCHVTASCSTPNVELCKELGADDVIDYKTTDVAYALSSQGAVFDLLVDNVGTPKDLYDKSEHFLKPSGKYVEVAGDPGPGEVPGLMKKYLLPSFLGGGSRSFQKLMVGNKHSDFVRLGKWVQEGKMKPLIDSTYPYEDAPKAFEKLRSRRAKGNIIVHVMKE
ncbi:NAD(P)-binding protein [Aulographum hederae CBS 113979]|uniref:NAD(P)-binding protein n=1 Tax=Aulographum hederae CBS 113979 TaxID=1176131 RepID=A0A6G1H0I4_9PEZI|nr:NAD(P)-binding protein [Aulographum hederae CBS 113979]